MKIERARGLIYLMYISIQNRITCMVGDLQSAVSLPIQRQKMRQPLSSHSGSEQPASLQDRTHEQNNSSITPAQPAMVCQLVHPSQLFFILSKLTILKSYINQYFVFKHHRNSNTLYLHFIRNARLKSIRSSE